MSDHIVVEKKCSKCNCTKPLQEFSKRKDSKDGRKGICNMCYIKKSCEKSGRIFIDRGLIKKGYNICAKCQEEKLLSEFKSDIKNTCKQCLKDAPKVYVENKFCTKCSTLKLNTDFAINNYSKDGLSTDCKKCKLSYKKTNYEAITEGTKVCKLCKLELNVSCFHKHKNLKDGLNTTCKLCNIKGSVEWCKNNKEKLSITRKIYFEDDLKRFISATRKSLQNSFKKALKGKYKKDQKSEEILGCSMLDYISHIESLFTEGMCFENYGACKSGECHKVWHVDHKIPLSSAKTEEEIIKLNHYTNLQPLWASENLSKGNKI